MKWWLDIGMLRHEEIPITLWSWPMIDDWNLEINSVFGRLKPKFETCEEGSRKHPFDVYRDENKRKKSRRSKHLLKPFRNNV